MPPAPTSRRLAYLVSQYPRLTHDFLLREIRELRSLGWDVHAFSVSPSDRGNDDLNPLEQEERRRTFYIKSESFLSVLHSHMRTLLTRPAGYLHGLLLAITLSNWHPRRLLYSFFYFIEAVVLGEQLRKAKVSHVHSHFTSTVALLSSKIFPLTMSMTIHGFREFRDPDGFHLAKKLRSCLFTIAISNYCRSQLMLECGAQRWDRIYVVPASIDPKLFSPANTGAAKPFLEIVCAARLVHLKGHLLLIDAFERIVNDGFPVRLTLVGDGPESPVLRAAVKERRLDHCVRFTGPINPARIREQYARADIFALASFTEGLPVALMEAMAMGIPCVASCITGIPELLRDGVTGLLFSPGNIEDLTRALRVLIDDPTLRQRMGEAARLHVIQNYNLHINVARLAEVFGQELAADGCHRFPASAPRRLRAKSALE